MMDAQTRTPPAPRSVDPLTTGSPAPRSALFAGDPIPPEIPLLRPDSPPIMSGAGGVGGRGRCRWRRWKWEFWGQRGDVGHGSVAGEVFLLAAGELRLRMGRLHVSRTATLFVFFFAFLGWDVSRDWIGVSEVFWSSDLWFDGCLWGVGILMQLVIWRSYQNGSF